jgi:zinc protease
MFRTITYRRFLVLAFAVCLGLAGRTAAAKEDSASGSYSVVVSKATHDDPQWKAVVDALVAKHGAKVVVFEKSVAEALPDLRRQFPRYACFVATPTETGREFVAAVSRLTRRLDDDPYTDLMWGILTGYDAQCALRIAKYSKPLVVHRVAAATDVELALCDEGVWYCELTAGRVVRREAGKEPQVSKGPTDSTQSLVDALNTYHADLFVTSGHASERDWQLGYTYRNGTFRCKDGQLFGLDIQGTRLPIRSDNPKVYLPVGNCLMGHIDGPQCMAVAYMNSAGVNQMIGYTVPSWYGYAGWGMLDYFLEQPGRFTMAEAFYANQQALMHRLATCFPGAEAADARGRELPAGCKPSAQAGALGLNLQDASGLLYDRDTVAFYGDPAWEARMAPAKAAWEQSLVEKDGRYTFEVRPLRGARSFEPINKNGSQRGGRPIFQLLPQRIAAGSVKIVEGVELEPLVTDNFLLLPQPRGGEPKASYRVVFEAAKK